MKKCLILIDTPLTNDHRVLNLKKQYDKPIFFDYTIVPFPKGKHLIDILIGIKVLFYLPIYWFKLNINYSLKPNGIVKGLNRSIRAYQESINAAKYLKTNYDMNVIKIIHANDLTCGMIGTELVNNTNINLIYDAHEVEFHRNRKNSLFRVAFDMQLEQKVINAAKKVIVVNRPIKMLYMDIYNIPESKITVIDNNHFTPHMGYAISMFNESIDEVAILYVGGGINGRKLESLGKFCVEIDVKVYAFFLLKIPDIAYEYKWILGSINYLPELLELIKKKRLVMWCCTEDLCLSYQLSLPNKFFQAIALGIPVIAYKGTYLADIVTQYHLGYIYDDSNLQDIINDMKINKNYERLLISVSEFQNKLFIEKLEL